MTTVTRDGVTLAYDEAGTGGPPMLLIHGMSCDRQTMGRQLDHFGRTRRTVAYDQRGHGDSDKPLDAPYDPASLADDARWLIGELGLDRPVVVGHSLGGSVALALVANNPGLASALVILDSTFGFDDAGRAELATFYDALTDDVYEATVREFSRQRLFDPGDDPAMERRMLDVMASCPMPLFLAMGRGLLAFDAHAAAAEVTVPTLFVASGRPWTSFDTIRSVRPDWYLGRTVGAGHFLQYLVADQVNAMMDVFLDRVAAGLTAAPAGDH